MVVEHEHVHAALLQPADGRDGGRAAVHGEEQFCAGKFGQAVLHAILAEDNRHFGYRVANEIARFVNLAAEQAGPSEEALWLALDLAVLQKVLPKFHGTQQELEKPLGTLFSFCVADEGGAQNGCQAWRLGAGGLVASKVQDAGLPASVSQPRLPRTAAKLWRMLRRLEQQGFTSYME